MVKGISRQVIVVKSPDEKLFEQAIFILREDAPEVTEAALLKEAERIIHVPVIKPQWQAALWAAIGATTTGLVWALTVCL